MNEQNGKVVNLADFSAFREKEPTPSAHSVNIETQSTGISRQQDFLKSFKNEAQGIIRSLEDSAQKIRPKNLGVIRINLLPNKDLKIPIDAVVEQDGEGFLARTIEIPLYGHGDDFIEAVDVLKYEIESLYDDLMEDDNFTDEWLRIKEYLKLRIIDR